MHPRFSLLLSQVKIGDKLNFGVRPYADQRSQNEILGEAENIYIQFDITLIDDLYL